MITRSKSRTKGKASLTSRQELIINQVRQMALKDKLSQNKVKVISHLVSTIAPRPRNLEAKSQLAKSKIFKKMSKFKTRAKIKRYKTKLPTHLSN